jgi:hypothetical protein
MDKDRLTKILTPRDRSILDAQAGTTWVPKEPKDLILPYADTVVTPPDRVSTEFRKQKAKEVYDGYGKIIETCLELEDEIEAQCKNVSIPLNSSQHLSVMNAVKRVFGTDGTQITFEMYKQCVQALAALGDKDIPGLKQKG